VAAPEGGPTNSSTLGSNFLTWRYCSCSNRRQHRSRPQAPPSPSALMGSDCSLAMRTDMDSNLPIHFTQHSSFPQRPIPPVSLAMSRSPTCRNSTWLPGSCSMRGSTDESRPDPLRQMSPPCESGQRCNVRLRSSWECLISWLFTGHLEGHFFRFTVPLQAAKVAGRGPAHDAHSKV